MITSPSIGRSLGRQPHLPDFLKHAPKLWLRHEAHGSISVQEGQPPSFLPNVKPTRRETTGENARRARARPSLPTIVGPDFIVYSLRHRSIPIFPDLRARWKVLRV